MPKMPEVTAWRWYLVMTLSSSMATSPFLTSSCGRVEAFLRIRGWLAPIEPQERASVGTSSAGPSAPSQRPPQ